MADRSQGLSPWIALLVGGLVLMVGLLVYLSYTGALRTPFTPAAIRVELPRAPVIPDAPRIPDAPTPRPQ